MAIRHAAVLGSPIGHSLSPALHQAAYRGLQLSDWSYGAYEVQAPALRGYVAELDSSWVGLSLTMPLKEAAFEVVDEVSDLAREVGAINTLVRRSGPSSPSSESRSSGTSSGWWGDNTDVYGVSQALQEAGCPSVASAVVLGSGATARSVVAALATLGCAKVTFAVRSQARQETLDQARRAGLDVDVVGLAQLADSVGDAPVVVSTLPPTAPSLVLPHGLRLPDHLLLDVVYAGWPTPLARMFDEAGASVVSGLEMLVHQAAEQVRLMTGLRPPVDQMRAAGLAAMASR